MKCHALTSQEKLWRQVWRVWPDAMQYEHIDTPFDAPQRLNASHHRAQIN